ncbi:MAG: hypothetical protein EON97_00275 [Chitinophagaceae bacterium]|nr:MAG: hypothetical protein EON97_00275 [Chitinophagaceae bacterium]
MDIMYFLKVLYRKKWIILSLSFLAVVAAFVFLVNKKPLYVSVAQYSTGFTSEKVKLVDGSTAIDLYTVDVKFDNVIETIKSPQVVNRVGYSLLLHDLSDPSNAYTKLSAKDKETPVYREMNVDTARKILLEKLTTHTLLHSNKKNESLLIEYLKLYGYGYEEMLYYLSVSRVARTDYLNIIYSSVNPDLSSRVVNSIGQEFLNYYRNLNSQRTDENAQTIKSMVATQQATVDSLSQILLSEKVSQGTIDPVSRTTSAMETVTEIESRLAEEKGKYNTHLNRLSYLRAQLNALNSSSGSTAGNNDEVIRLTNRRNDLVAELSRKGGNDPVLERQIDDLRAQIIQKSGAGTSRSKSREKIDQLTREINEEEALLNASRSTIDDYNARITRYMGMTNVNPGSGVKMDVIRAKLEMENEQLKTIREKYSQAEGLLRDDPTSNFIQTRMGIPPNQPESKNTLMKMLLSGMSVFLLTSLIFIFLEIFDTAAKTPSIFYRQTKLRSANILNRINLHKRSAVDVMLEDHSGRRYVATNYFKNSIRKLRYELLNSGKSTFLISSTKRSAGKTTIVEALAASLLLSHKKVLIIDLNFLNNSLTRKFNADVFIQDVAGKVNYSIPFSQQKVAGSTSYEGLDIIGCHEGNTTPSEVLFDLNMTDFLIALKEEYDFILMEGGALNLYADSKELMDYAEGVFLVFSADTGTTQSDAESLKFIQEKKDKFQGVILNKVLMENVNS